MQTLRPLTTVGGPATTTACWRCSLRPVPPDTPAWTWSDEQSVGFIRRRQAHEALIHLIDAELTARDRTPMEPDLSTDGVDEALTIMYGAVPSWGRFTRRVAGGSLTLRLPQHRA